MLQFLSCQNPAEVKTVFLVHGEYEKQLIWKEKLQAAGFDHVVIPDMQEKADL
jgi:metallo-beta-lactamase family protein